MYGSRQPLSCNSLEIIAISQLDLYPQYPIFNYIYLGGIVVVRSFEL
jgi:hypothetical protein